MEKNTQLLFQKSGHKKLSGHSDLNQRRGVKIEDAIKRAARDLADSMYAIDLIGAQK